MRTPPPRWRRPVVTGLLVLGAAGAGLLVRSQLGSGFRVVSTSMVPAVLPGDVILVRKLAARGRLPARGDVVLFSAVKDDNAQAGADSPPELIKRVVGLPGDEITMDGGRPVINGTPITSCDAGAFLYFSKERFSRGRLAVEHLDGRSYLAVQEPAASGFVRYKVKPGEVFVLGDNRGVSNDSRSWKDQRGAGVPLAAIQGRVSRVLLGHHRNGRLDLGRLLAPLGTEVHLPGVDVRALQAGIDRCLETLHSGRMSTLSISTRNGG